MQNEESQSKEKVQCHTNFKYNHTWQHDSLIKLGFIKSRSSHVIFDNSYKLHQICMSELQTIYACFWQHSSSGVQLYGGPFNVHRTC